MRHGLILAALVFSAPVAHAEDQIATIAGLTGTCQMLQTPDGDKTSVCDQRLMNVAYKSNHSSFKTIFGGQTIVSFYGNDQAAIGNRAEIQLLKIVTTEVKTLKSSVILARGTCSYTNPNAGPVHIDCIADTDNGNYVLHFLSDGKFREIKSF